MARLVETRFSSYKLTPEEEKNGQILTQNNIYVIRNQIFGLVNEKLELKFDALNPSVFMQREAELQGQINALEYLITLSDAASSPTIQET